MSFSKPVAGVQIVGTAQTDRATLHYLNAWTLHASSSFYTLENQTSYFL